jgi:hypothetical protein
VVERATDPFALDTAAVAQVRAEVCAVCVQGLRLAGFGSEQHQFAPEVVQRLDVPWREVA